MQELEDLQLYWEIVRYTESTHVCSFIQAGSPVSIVLMRFAHAAFSHVVEALLEELDTVVLVRVVRPARRAAARCAANDWRLTLVVVR